MDDNSSCTTKNLHSYEKIFGLGSTSFVWLCSLFLSLIFSVYIFSSSNLLKFTAIKADVDAPENGCFQRAQTNNESCDLFDGRWVPDEDGPLYSNFSCPTIPTIRNCIYNGRKDRDFLYWRWKPEQCHLPRFDSKAFLSIVQGKKMAFIGDSLARNQMESLLCLLSMEETPTSGDKDVEDKLFIRTWHFPRHNFTLTYHRSVFLVRNIEIVMNNGSSASRFALHLDEVDKTWSENISTVDHAIFSDGQWFLRPSYLYQGGNLIGCIHCRDPNVTDLGSGFGIRKAFEAAFKYVNRRRKGIIVIVRTFSPSHFEHGGWHNGGSCNRTRGFSREELKVGGDDWYYRNIQVEEFERAKIYGEKRGNRFELMDVTGAMLMRADGHPGEFWGNKWLKDRNDCLHWCLPGPIDTWNQFLLHMLHNIH